MNTGRVLILRQAIPEVRASVQTQATTPSTFIMAKNWRKSAKQDSVKQYTLLEPSRTLRWLQIIFSVCVCVWARACVRMCEREKERKVKEREPS